MNINRFKLIVVAGLSACAFAAPSTASAATEASSDPLCTPVVQICPIQIVINTLERVEREYDEFQELYREVEADLNAYLCRQTGSPTYCNH